MADETACSSTLNLSPGELLRAAGRGDQGAWQALVERYSTMIAAVTRAYRLDDADAGDVHQTTWLRLLEYKDRIRAPDSLGAWLGTTARNECLRIHQAARRLIPVGDEPDSLEELGQLVTAPFEDDIEDSIVLAERNATLKKAVTALSDSHRSLIQLLMADPAPNYEQVSAILRIPVGSIGPTRGRCLAKLRAQLAGAGIAGAS